MTILQAYRQLLAALYEVYDDREAANIANWVIEKVTGQKKIDRIVYKDLQIPKQRQEQLQNITSELLQHKPVQYVLNEAWFDGMNLYVDENVLVPRPETEELVDWIATGVASNTKYSGPNTQCAILDVGTGSGCIAVALKKRLPLTNVFAIDISDGALKVAERNAQEQNTLVTFDLVDILEQEDWPKLGAFDIIVSNPPYIKFSEKRGMNENVVKYEPHTALFVPDENALVFYKALAECGATHLKENGWLYVEINEALGEDVARLFEAAGYQNVELKKDLQGNDRMVRAQKHIADFEI
jgi:release factor glutamine methyltransferase